MAKETFAELWKQIEQKNDQVKSIFDKADDENREETAEERSEVRKLNKEIAELEARAAELKEGEEMRAANEKRREEARRNARLPLGDKNDGQNRGSDRYNEARRQVTNFVDHVLKDQEFMGYLKSLTPGSNRVPTSPSLELNQRFGEMLRGFVRTLVTGTSDTSAGAMVPTDYKPLVNGAPFRQLTVLDLVTMGTTDSDTVEHPRINGWTNNAAPTAEASATDDGSGEKPESAISMEKVTAVVKTIPTWIPVTTRALQDAGQLRTLLESFLMSFVREELEDQVLGGDGTGENLTGILNTSGTQSQAYTTSIIVTSRKARTKAKTPGRVTPNAYVFNPLDWEEFDLAQNLEGDFYFGGPSILGVPRLWGVPVVESEAMPENTGLLGDWRYAVVWERMAPTIRISDSHADFFIRNLVAMLVELRAAFGVLYPKAFVEIALA